MLGGNLGHPPPFFNVSEEKTHSEFCTPRIKEGAKRRDEEEGRTFSLNKNRDIVDTRKARPKRRAMLTGA